MKKIISAALSYLAIVCMFLAMDLSIQGPVSSKVNQYCVGELNDFDHQLAKVSFQIAKKVSSNHIYLEVYLQHSIDENGDFDSIWRNSRKEEVLAHHLNSLRKDMEGKAYVSSAILYDYHRSLKEYQKYQNELLYKFEQPQKFKLKKPIKMIDIPVTITIT